MKKPDEISSGFFVYIERCSWLFVFTNQNLLAVNAACRCYGRFFFAATFAATFAAAFATAAFAAALAAAFTFG